MKTLLKLAAFAVILLSAEPAFAGQRAKVFNVLDYGAEGNGATNCTMVNTACPIGINISRDNTAYDLTVKNVTVTK